MLKFSTQQLHVVLPLSSTKPTICSARRGANGLWLLPVACCNLLGEVVMRFVAIDVETANARFRSICQIGIVAFEGGREVAAESIFIDPGEEFDDINISIHGIEPHHVAGSPTFAAAQNWLMGHLGGQVAVCHTHFDRSAIFQASQHHAVPSVECTWLDTAKVARRAWPQFATAGYGLANLAREFGITFQHHDALEDARTAGMVLHRAMAEHSLDVGQWVERCQLGISGNPKGRESRAGDGDGPLLGETIVFTGALSVPRREAADLAHNAGARVDPGVTKDTTILVVGDTDLSRLAGAEKSSKHRKAEDMMKKGHPMKIWAESDFAAMIAADLGVRA
jgi:DNA polymerase-3 subunit epsilon